MRVTTSMISNQVIENLNIDLTRLQDISQQISTGKRISQSSDDPLGSQRVVNLKEAMSGIDQYQRNSQFITNWTNASETALASVGNNLKAVHNLAIRGANDATLTQNDLNALADNVNGLLNNIYQDSNTTLEGRSIFSGFQTQSQSFTATTNAANEITAVTYSGDSGVEQVEIDQNQVVNKNVAGNAIFQPAAGVNVFNELIGLRDALRSGNIAGVKNAITTVQNGHDQVLEQVGLLGNKTNQLESSNENLAAKKLGLVKLNSQLEDTDMPDAIVRLQTAQNVYTAALQSSAKILQQSHLMNFLS